MEIYKGASAFAGIAIGKIRFYRKGEYQIRQHQADDVKKELKNFDVARRHGKQTLKECQKSKWTQLIMNWIWNPNLWIEL